MRYFIKGCNDAVLVFGSHVLCHMVGLAVNRF